MIELAKTAPSLRSALRTSVFTSQLGRPAWEGAAPPPSPLGRVLSEETRRSYELLAEHLRRVHVVADEISGTIHAVTDKASWNAVTSWVIGQLEDGTLDSASEHLYCSFLPRHESYQALFGPHSRANRHRRESLVGQVLSPLSRGTDR